MKITNCYSTVTFGQISPLLTFWASFLEFLLHVFRCKYFLYNSDVLNQEVPKYLTFDSCQSLDESMLKKYHFLVQLHTFLAFHTKRFAIACVLLLVTLLALSEILENLEQKIILQTIEQLIQFSCLFL